MNPWWLVLIVPASATLGVLLSCLLVMNADNRTMERQERMLAAYRQQLVDLQEERRRSEE